MATENGGKVANDGFNLIIILEGKNQNIVVDVMLKSGELLWTAGHICKHLIIRRDGADINQTKADKLSNTGKMSSALMHVDSTFIITMKALVKYAAAFTFQDRVMLVDMSINEIVRDTLSSKYLPKCTQAPFSGYIRIATLCVNESSLFPVREGLKTHAAHL